MKRFDYVRPQTCAEASGEMENGAVYMAGGSDLLGELKQDILPKYPKKVVSLRDIPELKGVAVEDGKLKVGAMTTLAELTESETVASSVPALAEAAHSVATPLVRGIGTIGGNICQDVRCWFYRYPEGSGGALNCARKGGAECYALKGDSRFHSIFGGMKVASPVGCSGGCPNNTDIGAYMEKLRAGDWAAAAEIFYRVNPMPTITSRVCAHLCENHCNRMTVMATEDIKNADDCVSIHTVERALGDYAMQHKDVYYKAPEKETGVNVAVVGAGPAGLTAAYYLRKAGHSVTVYDKMEKAGGMLQYAIPNYRLPKHYVDEVAEAIKGMGVDFEMGKELGRDFDAESLERRFDKVFYATGAWKRPVLGFDGEEFTEFGLEFLVEVNKWMNKKKRENVIVIGGGNVAMDVAVTAKRLGAKSVTLIFRKPENELTASREEIERAKEEGVQIMPQWGVKRALYKDGQVTGMELKRTFYTRDEKGKLVLHYDEDETTIVNADSVLMAAGQQVDLSFLGDYASARGRLVVDEESQATSHKGVYAGGDIVSGPSTVISAIRQGRNAAEAMNESVGIAKPVYKHDGFLKFDPSFSELHRGVKDISIPVEERNLEREDTVTISQEAAEAEAKRCMNCGCYSVNASDISPVLVALDAEIKTTKKILPAAELFTEKLKVKDMLDPDELVTEIDIPVRDGVSAHYDKFRLRDSVDFAMVSLASAYELEGGVIKSARLVFGGVAPVPLRREAAESYLTGKAPTEENAEEAARIALEGAVPFEKNAYKVQVARSLVKQSVLRLKA